MNVIEMVSTTAVICKLLLLLLLLLLLTGYQFASGGNLHYVRKTLVSCTVSVPQSCTDRYSYNKQFCQVTACKMSSNNIAKYS
jgi:hypothetical protein